MRLSKRHISLISGVAFIALAISIFERTLFVAGSFVVPAANTVIANQRAYNTLEAIRNDYTLHTMPLPQDVVDDLCSNFGIWETSEDCQLDKVAYAPDFFDEIKEYFHNIPQEKRTYDTVDAKLGMYFVNCDEPATDGRHVCYYDINNDGQAYFILVFFNGDDQYYQIIANTRAGDT